MCMMSLMPSKIGTVTLRRTLIQVMKRNVEMPVNWKRKIKNPMTVHGMIMWTSCQQNHAIQEHRPCPVTEAVFGEAKVICSGGDPFDNLLLANQSAIQFGQHRGRTFKWMLDNDLGYSLMVLASHQREHEAGRMDRGVLMFNKVAFLQYACAFPEVAEYIRLRRQREGTLPGCEGDCLVGFGLHKRTTYKELYDTKDKERRSSSIIFTAHTSQLSSTGAECRSKKGISGF
ncbi:uncharacterized protein LOC127450594 isoform X3 [Myxocyprinus asiaticus]|nr:uncharacterized protein LOC127450594 isoform X3 [Myxocyprinus asiaticus]